MAIILRLDRVMADRKMSLNELSDKVGITLANLSILKNNKAKAIRFSTLDAICKALDCKVEDIIEYGERYYEKSEFIYNRDDSLFCVFIEAFFIINFNVPFC